MAMPKLACDSKTGRSRPNYDDVRFALAVIEHGRRDSLFHGSPR
jgi:hypothetical protein